MPHRHQTKSPQRCGLFYGPAGTTGVPSEKQKGHRSAVTFSTFVTKYGGATRDRTADLLHAMQALSQLSYNPDVCE